MKISYENKWFSVIDDNGYYYLKENNSDNGAVILASINESFLFIKIKRDAHDKVLIEAPRGYGDKGESSLECAIRELHEETGYLTNKASMKRLGSVLPNSAILSSRIDIYHAELDESMKRGGHDAEVEEIVKIPKSSIAKILNDGIIEDGFTLSALTYYFAMNQSVNFGVSK